MQVNIKTNLNIGDEINGFPDWKISKITIVINENLEEIIYYEIRQKCKEICGQDHYNTQTIRQ